MLEAKGYKPKVNVTDNQAAKYIKKNLTKKRCKLQLVEPHNHHVNAAKRAIQTFMDAFISGGGMKAIGSRPERLTHQQSYK